MARALDNWSVYFVDGKPFYGRFSFYKLHTTEKITIYDEFGTALSNPILSNIDGRTDQQVFLPDEDVTVVLESFVGSGNMSDNASNYNAWREALTFDSLRNTTIIDIGDSTVLATAVGTIEALRELTDNVANYVMLLGYYELGDMPPVYYKLEEDNHTADTGGDVIRVSETHIWRMIPPRVLDVRSFGVFPAIDISQTVAYESQLRLAFNFAYSQGLAVNMPNPKGGDAFYMLEGGNHQLNNTLYVAGGVHITGKDGTDSSLTVDKIEGAAPGFLYAHGTYNHGRVFLTVRKAYASWMNNWYNSFLDINATEEFVLDNHIPRNKTFSNLVRVTVSQEGFTTGNAGVVEFDNIQEFESPRNIALDAQVVFKNMSHVSDSWFAVDNEHQDLDLSIVRIQSTCTLVLNDFLFVQNYVKVAYANGQKVFNLEGRTLPEDMSTTYNNCTFTNGVVEKIKVLGDVTMSNLVASFSDYVSSGITKLTMNNVRFSGSFTFSPLGAVNVDNCIFTGSSSSVLGLSFQNAPSCTLRDSIFSGYAMRVPYNAFISGCTFDSVTSSSTPTSITAYGSDVFSKISLTFSNNTLTGGKLWLRKGGVSGTNLIKVENAVFVGNSITNSTDGTNFIRWNEADMATTGHTYSYKNNDGPDVLQSDSYATYIIHVPFVHQGDTPTTRMYVEYTDVTRDHQSEYYDLYQREYFIKGIKLSDFNLFAFGTDDYSNKFANVNIAPLEDAEYPSDAYWHGDSNLKIEGGWAASAIGALTSIPNSIRQTGSWNNANGGLNVVTPPAFCYIKLVAEVFGATKTAV